LSGFLRSFIGTGENNVDAKWFQIEADALRLTYPVRIQFSFCALLDVLFVEDGLAMPYDVKALRHETAYGEDRGAHHERHEYKEHVRRQ
jgi:hypothetical protein